MKPVHFIFTKTLCLAFMFTVLAGCSKDEDKYLVSTDLKEIQLSPGKTEATFKINSSGEWRIEADGLEGMYGPNAASTDWYTIAPAGGTGDAIVTVTLKEDITAAERTSTLKIIGKNNTESVILKYSAD
jgi:flagellar basal body L-ring protein FlgH